MTEEPDEQQHMMSFMADMEEWTNQLELGVVEVEEEDEGAEGVAGRRIAPAASSSTDEEAPGVGRERHHRPHYSHHRLQQHPYHQHTYPQYQGADYNNLSPLPADPSPGLYMHYHHRHAAPPLLPPPPQQQTQTQTQTTPYHHHHNHYGGGASEPLPPSLPPRAELPDMNTTKDCEDKDASSSSSSSKNKKDALTVTRGPSRRSAKKKPKGLPKRPLSAYNLFFQHERIRVYAAAESGRVSFEELGKLVGKRWRALSDMERKKYDKLADAEVERYRQERNAYEEARRQHLRGNSTGTLSSLASSAGAASSSSDLEYLNSTSATRDDAQPYLPTIMDDRPHGSTKILHLRNTTTTMGNPQSSSPALDYLQSSVANPSMPPPPSLGAANTTGVFFSVPPSSNGTFPPNGPLPHSQYYAPPLPLPPPPSGVGGTSAVVASRLQSHSHSGGGLPSNLPDGSQIVMEDVHGRTIASYRVQYACYRMRRTQADAYMSELSEFLHRQPPSRSSGNGNSASGGIVARTNVVVPQSANNNLGLGGGGGNGLPPGGPSGSSSL